MSLATVYERLQLPQIKEFKVFLEMAVVFSIASVLQLVGDLQTVKCLEMLFVVIFCKIGEHWHLEFHCFMIT